MKLHKLNCPNCNGSLDMKITEGTTAVYCPYCGQQFHIDDEHKKYTHTKNININKNINQYIHNRYTDDADVIRATNEANKEKWAIWQYLIVLAIPIVLLVSIFSCDSIKTTRSKNQGKIQAGYYEDLIGENYQTVEAHFEAAGFINIELIDLDDAGVAFWNDGKVEMISVGGDTSFNSSDWFDPETKVVISYH